MCTGFFQERQLWSDLMPFLACYHYRYVQRRRPAVTISLIYSIYKYSTQICVMQCASWNRPHPPGTFQLKLAGQYTESPMGHQHYVIFKMSRQHFQLKYKPPLQQTFGSVELLREKRYSHKTLPQIRGAIRFSTELINKLTVLCGLCKRCLELLQFFSQNTVRRKPLSHINLHIVRFYIPIHVGHAYHGTWFRNPGTQCAYPDSWTTW